MRNTCSVACKRRTQATRERRLTVYYSLRTVEHVDQLTEDRLVSPKDSTHMRPPLRHYPIGEEDLLVGFPICKGIIARPLGTVYADRSTGLMLVGHVGKTS